ncbi:MAG: YdcF family protein [Nitratireductor sp.]
MFFVLSKMFWAFARPLNFLFLLAVFGAFLARTSWKRTARLAIMFSIAMTALTGFTQLPDWLIYRLETTANYSPIPEHPYGIIVLGGGLDADSAVRKDDYHLGEAADRLVLALELKRRYPQARLVYSGGLATIAGEGIPETRAAEKMITALYGDTRETEFEPNSRNTWQNAVFTAEMLGDDRNKTWLLVTSAFHVPRALGCFRKAGINVIAVPTDFRADEFSFPWLTGDMAGQFIKMSLFTKELIGLVAYRLTGKMDQFLPR